MFSYLISNLGKSRRNPDPCLQGGQFGPRDYGFYGFSDPGEAEPPVSEIVERLFPWIAAGFVVMFISGSLLFYAIPVRTFHNIFFRLKVVMLMLSGLNVWIFHSTVYRRVARWDLNPIPPRSARVAAGVSLTLWAAIIVAGRMIAYNWFD